ncbi:MAG: hypothetical protein KAG10_09035, partial [Methylococcales bacterium]|nr:hypothetical protein [Methylococcales bacterium]
MDVLTPFFQPKIAVLISEGKYFECVQKLAQKLQVPLYKSPENHPDVDYFLQYQHNVLALIDKNSLKKQGISVNINPRSGEQLSYPAPKKNDLAKAIGRQT